MRQASRLGDYPEKLPFMVPSLPIACLQCTFLAELWLPRLRSRDEHKHNHQVKARKLFLSWYTEYSNFVRATCLIPESTFPGGNSDCVQPEHWSGYS